MLRRCDWWAGGLSEYAHIFFLIPKSFFTTSHCNLLTSLFTGRICSLFPITQQPQKMPQFSLWVPHLAAISQNLHLGTTYFLSQNVLIQSQNLCNILLVNFASRSNLEPKMHFKEPTQQYHLHRSVYRLYTVRVSLRVLFCRLDKAIAKDTIMCFNKNELEIILTCTFLLTFISSFHSVDLEVKKTSIFGEELLIKTKRTERVQWVLDVTIAVELFLFFSRTRIELYYTDWYSVDY